MPNQKSKGDRIIERLEQRKDTCGETHAQFGRKHGLSSSAVNNIFGSRKSVPGGIVLAQIAENDPELNMRWLLTGQGEMVEPSTEQLETLNRRLNSLAKKLSSMEETNEILREHISLLKAKTGTS